MTEGDRFQDKIAAARSHPQLAVAMSTPPPTWLTPAVVLTVVMVGILVLTFAIYPWNEMDRMPAPIRAQMTIAWVPTIGATLAVIWLLFDAIGLASAPTRRVIAVAGARPHSPAPYYLRLVTEDGADREYRARRKAASLVKLGLVPSGEVGVAILKGEVVVDWVPLPPPPERVYDRR
jgi:hypothetical protein